jgi:hypothetical protein
LLAANPAVAICDEADNCGGCTDSRCVWNPQSNGLIDYCYIQIVPQRAYPVCNAPASAKLDPHFTTAHGGRFDYKGKNNTIYNLLSHTNVSVNSLFMYADFKTPSSKLVHGSFMRAAFVAVRTNASRMLHIEYRSDHSLSASVGIESVSREMAAGEALKIDNVDISLNLKDRTLSVKTPEWITTATSKVMPGIVGASTCATGRCIINVQLVPLFDADHAKVAPHGLIGQSWDGDDVAVHGKTDDYSRKEVTTMAMGEGSIEGVAEQYEMASGFATDFAFSRFGSTSASPRNVSALSGIKVKRSTSAVVVD